jgi:hypothetical protein
MCKTARLMPYRFTLAAFRASRAILDLLPGADKRQQAARRRKATAYAIKHNTRKHPALFQVGDGVVTLDLRGTQ